MSQPSCSLADKHCAPCQGGVPPLTAQEAQSMLGQLSKEWGLNDKGHLAKQYQFDDFMGAMAFANRVAQIAEMEGHHPDITISFGACGMEIWTHKIQGLTESDFILAAKIDSIFNG